MSNVIEQILTAIKSEKVIEKHINPHHWMSGCCTEVYPITLWTREVSIQMDTHRNIFRKAIQRILAAHPELFKNGYFCSNDDSAPAEVRLFYTNQTAEMLQFVNI